MPDVVSTVDQGVIRFQNAKRFHGVRTNAISHMTMRRVQYFLRLF